MNRWIARSGALALLALSAQTPMAAQTLFYNGNWSLTDGQTSATNTGNADAVLFENFVVGGSGWNVTGLFGDFLRRGAGWSTANWEIRSGMSAGNGGTLVASGFGTTTNVATGRSNFNYTEYRATVSGLNLTLGPGTYWLGLAPVGLSTSPGNDIYLSYTSGANGVNALLDGDFFRRSLSDNYQEPPFFGNPNFAVGVLGTLATTTVPEPGSMLLVAGGLIAVGFSRRRRTS